jgi:WD40 repeat protein
MFCPKCGKEIEQDWLACAFCGHGLKLRDERIVPNSLYRQRKIAILLMSSILFIFVGILVTWQGFRLINPSPTSDDKTTTKQELSPTSNSTQRLEIIEESIKTNIPITESSIPDQAGVGRNIPLTHPTGLTRIAAENAVLVGEIARLGGGTYSIFQSDGSIITEENIPIKGYIDALLSPDSDLLLLSGEFGKAVLNLATLELDFLEEIDYKIYMFSPDGQGFLTRIRRPRKSVELIYYDFRTDTIIPFTQSPYEPDDFTDSSYFSPDSKLFAATFDNKTVQVWSVHNGDLLLDLDISKESTQRISKLLFSPDSSQLAISTSWKDEAETVLINPATGEIKFKLEGRHVIDFLPLDNLLITFGVHSRKVWDLNTSTLLGEIDIYDEAKDKEALANHPLFELLSPENGDALRQFLNFPKSLDGRVEHPLSLGKSQQSVQIKGANPYEVHLLGHTANVGLATFIMDHSLILSHAEDGTIRFWGVYENQLSRLLIGHEATISKVAFSPDGSLLASVDHKGMLWLWDIKTRTPIGNWQVFLEPANFHLKSLYFSRDGSKLLFVPSGREIYIRDVKSQNIIFSLFAETQIFSTALLFPNGDLLAVRKYNKTIREFEWIIYRISDNSIVNPQEGQMNLVSMSWISDLSPDGVHLAELWTDTTNQVKINIYDINYGEVMVSIPIRTMNDLITRYSVLFNSDGSKLTDGTSVWETKNWHETLQFPRDLGEVRFPIRFLDDGKYLSIFQYHYFDDKNTKPGIEIFRIPDGMMVNKIWLDVSFYEGSLPSIDISPDMNIVAAAYGNRIIITEIQWDK